MLCKSACFPNPSISNKQSAVNTPEVTSFCRNYSTEGVIM